MCYLLYFPLSIVFTTIFAIVCVILAPITYLLTVYGLMRRICEDYEPIEGEDSSERPKTFLKFLIFGPVIIAFSIPVDCCKFYYNLFTKPEIEATEEKVAITQEFLDQFKLTLD